MADIPLTLTDLYQGEFADGGRGEAGPAGWPLFDCWGLVRARFALAGVVVPDFDEGAMDTEGKNRRFLDEARSGRWVRLESPEPLCLVAASTHPGAPWAVNHFGVFEGHGRFVHIQRGRRVHRDGILVPPWKRQIHSFWRWVG